MRNTLVKIENPKRIGTEIANVARGQVIFDQHRCDVLKFRIASPSGVRNRVCVYSGFLYGRR